MLMSKHDVDVPWLVPGVGAVATPNAFERHVQSEGSRSVVARDLTLCVFVCDEFLCIV